MSKLPRVHIHVTLVDGNAWQTTASAKNVHAAGGLPSGKLVKLGTKADDQPRDILARPYYRKVIKGEKHIFAVQVKSKEATDGK